MICREDRDVLLLQPRNHRRIESSVFPTLSPSSQVGTNFFAACPNAGANEHRIPWQYFQSGLFEPRLNVVNVDWSARFEIFQALELRNIDEDTSREDSILEVVN